ncbi:hypothetical protein GCM10011374_35380 [Kocuria dechangensis]|uniref:Uncharacterized protein n=1 Tax=Kocuria dechangensis TaxID=1176249 RepID=A0A917LZR4_9MICC|nr:hypothetical protein [Kocuria dechangensis]GGG67995.1 hypothetical protein GCM10011374_35380 [Kocuria dechangensis]
MNTTTELPPLALPLTARDVDVPVPEKLELADAFGAQLHPGDAVTALFRGPELRPVLVRGVVTGAEGGSVLVVPAAYGGPLLDGTVLTAGETFAAEPELVVRQDDLIPCTDFHAGPVEVLAHRDAHTFDLSSGDTVAFAVVGMFGCLGWGRGRIVAETGRGVEIEADTDCRVSAFDLTVRTGERIACASMWTVRLGAGG